LSCGCSRLRRAQFLQGFRRCFAAALETVFDAPIQELEALLLRLRSTLTPSLSANEEIAAIILEQVESA